VKEPDTSLRNKVPNSCSAAHAKRGIAGAFRPKAPDILFLAEAQSSRRDRRGVAPAQGAVQQIELLFKFRRFGRKALRANMHNPSAVSAGTLRLCEKQKN
jgi:hypothetical protein